MPTLLELQTAMQASLVHRDNEAVSAMLAGHITADRLDIYRNHVPLRSDQRRFGSPFR